MMSSTSLTALVRRLILRQSEERKNGFAQLRCARERLRDYLIAGGRGLVLVCDINQKSGFWLVEAFLLGSVVQDR